MSDAPPCPEDPTLRITLLPRDTNAAGSIFGGILLAQIDLAGVQEAHKVNPAVAVVTVAMEKVVFLEPVYVGDLASFYTTILKVGRTSVTVHVDVRVRRRFHPEKEIKVTEAEVVYVAVDDNRRPTPIREASGGAGN